MVILISYYYPIIYVPTASTSVLNMIHLSLFYQILYCYKTITPMPYFPAFWKGICGKEINLCLMVDR